MVKILTRSRASLSMPVELHEVLANASLLRSEYMELVG